MNRGYTIGLICLIGLIASASGLAAESPETFFELHIRPLFANKCAGCHASDSRSKNRLKPINRTTLLQGGEYGPAIVPGSAEFSLLMDAVKRIHKELRMPPESEDRLSKLEIERLAKWINEGAVWPGDDSRPVSVALTGLPSTSSDHWSFQPRKLPKIPNCEDERWSRSSIDRFVHAVRQTAEVKPVGRADRRTLIRRATFGLTGLPPTPDAVDAFVNSSEDEDRAFAAVIDRLLAAPAYGERWGRHWLDVARYADTQGDVGDFPIPGAYLYRNWVIDALNADMPYDEFIRRQVAGDLLAVSETDSVKARESIVATGFIALSRRFGNTNADDMHLTIEDTLDTIGRGVMGLTMRCARCHDHKFDAISQRDYYGLYGVFASTRYPWMGASNSKSPSDLAPALPGAENQRKADEFWKLITRYEYQLNNHFRPWLKPALDAYRKVTNELKQAQGNGSDLKRLKAERERHLKFRSGKFRELMLHGLTWIKKEKARLGKEPSVEMLFAVGESKPADARLHLRGEPRRLGDPVRRSAPAALGHDPFANKNASGRLELARWLTEPKHPLTARVIVNRVWYHHFGRGLVKTLDNLGVQGAEPSHPELLDWLAESLVTDGWSLKRLHRRIMLSETYRLRSGADARNESIDPENTFLWRHNRRRLEAEAIRDAILFVSDRLDPTTGGPHPFKPWYVKKYSLNGPFNENYTTLKRSVYLMTQRLFKHPFLGLFDGPDTNQSIGARKAANLPGQALYLMNSDFVRVQSLCLADRTLEHSSKLDDRLNWLWRRAYGRLPERSEAAAAGSLIKAHFARAKDRSHLERESWAGLARAVLTSNEFLFID